MKTIELEPYMKMMGLKWEIIKKAKHYLIRYDYRNNKGRTMPRYTEPIDDVKNKLLFDLLVKTNKEYDYRKYFPIKMDNMVSMVYDYYQKSPYDAIDFLMKEYRTEIGLHIENYYIPYSLRDDYKKWIIQNGYGFVLEGNEWEAVVAHPLTETTI